MTHPLSITLPPHKGLLNPDRLLTFDPKAWETTALCRMHPHLRTDTTQGSPESYGHGSWCDIKSNCYVYALGDRSLLIPRLVELPDTGALSGKAMERPRKVISASTVVDFAKADGLIHTGDDLIMEDTSRPIALFVAPMHDFHWLRLDKTSSGGLVWTQKYRNELPCVAIAPDGTPVNDPRTLQWQISRMHPFPMEGTMKFVSFFNVPHDLSICSSVAKAAQSPRPRLWLSESERAAVNHPTQRRIVIPQLG